RSARRADNAKKPKPLAEAVNISRRVSENVMRPGHLFSLSMCSPQARGRFFRMTFLPSPFRVPALRTVAKHSNFRIRRTNQAATRHKRISIGKLLLLRIEVIRGEPDQPIAYGDLFVQEPYLADATSTENLSEHNLT